MNKQEYRKFGLIMALFISMIFGVLMPWIFNHAFARTPWIVGSFLAGWALVHPVSLAIIYRPWMAMAKVLGHINTTIILSLIFYILITPAALVLRLAGKDAMERKLERAASSYWKESGENTKSNMENIY